MGSEKRIFEDQTALHSVVQYSRRRPTALLIDKISIFLLKSSKVNLKSVSFFINKKKSVKKNVASLRLAKLAGQFDLARGRK